MPFGDFIENVVKPAIAPHPDAARVDFSQVSWRLDDARFQPDPQAGLAANGIGHKSLLHLSTPGLDGLHGSFN
jgi:phenol hydroxylase P4 protein